MVFFQKIFFLFILLTILPTKSIFSEQAELDLEKQAELDLEKQAVPAMPIEKQAVPVTFPILGFKTVPKEPIMLDVPWNEAWFGEKTAFEYHHDIARIACVFAEMSYIEDVEEHPTTNVLYRSYKALGVEDENILFHYDINYSDPLGNNQSGVSFAQKVIKSSLGEKVLVFCIVRGTPRNANEWVSNVNVSDSTHKEEDFHEGFFIAANQLYKELIDYLNANNIDAKDSFLLMTGHSRGASVANMLAAIIANSQELDTSKVYCYTFGTPNVTTESDCHSEKYGFIYNIESVEDLCATLPSNRYNWKYQKYGKTKTLVNRWSVDEATFTTYVNRMNVYLNRFILRDYKPFGIGNFFPSQISRLFVILNPSVKSFYESPIELHDKCVFTFNIVFPEKKKAKKKNPSLFTSAMFGVLNSMTNGAFSYANVAVFDMHMCEVYLSWFMALTEKELFIEKPSSQIVFSGSFNAVITDSKGKEVIRIIDGLSSFYAIKPPAAAMSLMGKTVVGLSGNENYNVEITQSSLLPSPVSIKIEHYAGDGTFIESGKRLYLSPKYNKVYAFTAGKATAESFNLDFEISERENASDRAKKLPSATSFFISPSISTDMNFNGEIGLDAGIRAAYLSAFLSGKSYSIGIGSEQNIWWRLYFDEGIYLKHFFSIKDSKRENYFIPSARIALSYKPLHTVKFFASATFDLDTSFLPPSFRLGVKL